MSRTSLACALLLLLLLPQGCDTAFKEQPDAGIRPDAGDSGAADADMDAKDSGWTLVYADPKAVAGESLNAIWVADRDNVFAVGDNGQSVWLEQGAWQELNKSKGLNLYGVWGRSAKEVYAVGRYELDGAPAVSRYDGASWTAQGPIPAHVTALTDAWGVGTQVYFTGLEGQIFQHDPVNHPTKPYHMAAKTGGCPQLSDPGPILWAIDGSGLDNVLTAGDSGLLAHRDANGWMRLCHPDSKVAYRAVFSPPGSTDFYLGANYLGLWRFTGRATATLKLHEDRATKGADQRHLWSIWGTSAAAILAVGDEGTILYFDGAGAGARVLPSPTSGALFGISGADGKNVYICGEGNRIWRGELPSD